MAFVCQHLDMTTSSFAVENSTTDIERHEFLREAMIMSLYISIVLLAAVSSLPDTFGDDAEGGVLRLAATIWGTTIGLALAHWFAFTVVAIGYRGGAISKNDVKAGGIQVGAAAAVALLTTIPVVMLSATDLAIDAALIGPGLVLAASGYFIALKARSSHSGASLAAITVLLVGFAIAVVKSVISGGH